LNFRARLVTASTIGGLIQKITINVRDLDPSFDALFSTVVENLKELEDLTLIYEKDDETARPELVQAFCRLVSVSKLRVEEAGVDMTSVPAGYEETERSRRFIDYMLNSFISCGNTQVKSLAHIASATLHPSVFHNLRTQPTQLRTLVFRASIQYNLRDWFNEPTQWSSAATLEKLVIRACSGTHYTSIGHHVVSGIFGNLKRLVVIGSGYIDNNLLGLSPPALSIRPLDLLEIDHAFDWEVLALAIIPARTVHATRVFRQAIVNALTQVSWAGLEILKVQNWSDEEENLLPELRKACNDRDVKLQAGAVPYGRCTCHNE
jgi:hypothetical protein